jgi:ribosomal protein L7/L12
MLREAGISVALAYLSTRGDGQIPEEVPWFWANHVILLVSINGREHWVDPTARMADWDRLPWCDRDRVCYVFDGERVIVRRTPQSAEPPAALWTWPPWSVWLPLVLAAAPLPLLFAFALPRQQTREDRDELWNMPGCLVFLLVAVLCSAFPDGVSRIVGSTVAGVVSHPGVWAGWGGGFLVGLSMVSLTRAAIPKIASWKARAAVLLLVLWWVGVALLTWLNLWGVAKNQVIQIFVGFSSTIGGGFLLLVALREALIGARGATPCTQAAEDHSRQDAHAQAGSPPTEQTVPPPPVQGDPLANASPEVVNALRRGQKIEAIKHYRENTGAGLADAKQFVEEVQRRMAEIEATQRSSDTKGPVTNCLQPPSSLPVKDRA